MGCGFVLLGACGVAVLWLAIAGRGGTRVTGMVTVTFLASLVVLGVSLRAEQRARLRRPRVAPSETPAGVVLVGLRLTWLLVRLWLAVIIVALPVLVAVIAGTPVAPGPVGAVLASATIAYLGWDILRGRDRGGDLLLTSTGLMQGPARLSWSGSSVEMVGLMPERVGLDLVGLLDLRHWLGSDASARAALATEQGPQIVATWLAARSPAAGD